MTEPVSLPRPAGHALIEALIAQGASTAFGVPGESYLAALDGFHEHRDRIRFVACRHEGGASYMAEAQGKLSGRPGLCFVTRGPGASNAAIGLHTAFQDSTPMILFIGQVARSQRDREAFQEVDYRQMFGPGTLGFAKWVGEIDDADRLPEYVARAYHVAMQGRPGPVVLSLPEDMLTTPTAAPVVARIEPALAAPAPEALARLRELLVAAERPFVIVGGSAWTASACDALERFAERWQLPVGCAFRFQDVFDNRHANYAGDVGIGINAKLAKANRGRRPDQVAIGRKRSGRDDDRRLRAARRRPRPRQRLVHIHAGAEELGRVYDGELLINASMACAAPALATLARPASIRWREWTDAAHADSDANRVPTPVAPLDMAEVIRCIDRHLGDDTIFTNGAGNFAGWLSRFHRFVGMRHAGRTHLAPTSGAMGYGVPAAVAAALLAPQRSVVNLAGDGDFLMTGQELATATAQGLGRGAAKLISIVVDNGSYGTIRMHQEREYPGRVSGSDLGNPDFAALARAYGWFAGDCVDTTEAFEPALVAALAADRPALIHLRLDADVITSRTTLASIRRNAEARLGKTTKPS